MSPLSQATEPSSSVRLEAAAKDAADPVTPDALATLDQTASPVPPVLQEPQESQADLQLFARRLKFHHATHAHPAHQAHQDQADPPETADHQAHQASQETTDSPAQLAHPDRTDHQAHLAQMEIGASQADQLRALPTLPARRVQMESQAHQVFPATTALQDATDSPVRQDPTDHPAHPVHPERTAKTAQLDQPANRDLRASAVSAPSTAPSTAVSSSKMEQDENKKSGSTATYLPVQHLPVVPSFIDIFRIAVILCCHQSVSRR